MGCECFICRCKIDCNDGFNDGLDCDNCYCRNQCEYCVFYLLDGCSAPWESDDFVQNN